MHVRADFEFPNLVQALEAAELFTTVGYEVTRPLEIAGEFCIQIEADFAAMGHAPAATFPDLSRFAR